MNIIELIGAPGSGKTTIGKIIKKIGKRNSLNVLSIDEAVIKCVKLKSNLEEITKPLSKDMSHRIMKKYYHGWLARKYQRKFLKKQKDLYEQAVFVLKNQISDYKYRHKLLGWFVEHAGLYLFLQENLESNDYVVFPEGLIHRLVHFHVSPDHALDFELLKKSLSLAPKIRLIVYVISPNTLCHRRLVERGLTYRLKHKKNNEIRFFIDQSISGVETAIESLSERKYSIIAVDNSGTLSKSEMDLEYQIIEHATAIKRNII